MGQFSSPPPERLREPSPARLRATIGFGRLIATGLMQRSECLDALADGLPLCARIRLAHALTDSTLHWHRARNRARRALRATLADRIATRAPAATLRAAAHEANRDMGHPLRQAEVDAMAAQILARALAHPV